MITALPLAIFGNLGATELIVIAGIGLLLFGKRLPEVGKSLGQAIVGFKKGLKETGDEVRQGTETLSEEPHPSTPKTASPAIKASTVSGEKKRLRPASDEP